MIGSGGGPIVPPGLRRVAVDGTTTTGSGTAASPIAGTAGSNVQRFIYVCTGAEAADFRVNLPAARADALYNVSAELQDQVSGYCYDVRCPTSTAGDRLTTSFRVLTGYPVQAGDKILFTAADLT